MREKQTRTKTGDAMGVTESVGINEKEMREEKEKKFFDKKKEKKEEQKMTFF